MVLTAGWLKPRNRKYYERMRTIVQEGAILFKYV